MGISERLGAHALVPVVEIADVRQAVPLGEALIAGGLPCAEITFRTAAAPDAIRALRAGCPELLVGADTVLTVEQAEAAVAAGAEFLVAPGSNPDVMAAARRLGAPMVPGVCTPSEIERAMASGIDVLKFFPAEVCGGVAFLKSVAPVYPGVRYIPTGGIGPGNLPAYLALPQVLACGGSWMVKRELIAAADFEAIASLAADAVALVRSCRPGVETASTHKPAG
jgi:2-dehydro-3-deoxyphosphogluconate aldolase/(4S)-4-hydroxy-2-oxoglutarate aldolase